MKRFKNLAAMSALIVFLLSPAAVISGEGDLVGATYLGGSGYEGWQYSGAISAAVGVSGDVYVVGMTASVDFPSTPGVYQCTGCGNGDIFVARLNGDLTALLASTVFGGSQIEVMPSVGVSADGAVYVAGFTSVSPRQFEARDTRPADVSDREVTYYLYSR